MRRTGRRSRLSESRHPFDNPKSWQETSRPNDLGPSEKKVERCRKASISIVTIINMVDGVNKDVVDLEVVAGNLFN